MKTRYLLESMGVDVDTMTNELDRARAHNHAQALEGGLRRQVYWRSPEVSICSLSAAMALPYWVVILSLGAVPSNYSYLMLCVSSGKSFTKGQPLLLKPSLDSFNTGHRRICQMHSLTSTSCTATTCSLFCTDPHFCTTLSTGCTSVTFGSHAPACPCLPSLVDIRMMCGCSWTSQSKLHSMNMPSTANGKRQDLSTIPRF
jgi:hypothetical protein